MSWVEFKFRALPANRETLWTPRMVSRFVRTYTFFSFHTFCIHPFFHA